MKKLIKDNLKIIFAFIFGMIISGSLVYAYSFQSSDVLHTNSDGTTTSVETALNSLYTLHNSGNALASDILSGKTALSGGSLLTGTMSKPTTVIGNAYTGNSGYLNGTSALSSSTNLTLNNYKSNNKYVFNLGGKEQITFPSGYYQYPINVTNGGANASLYNQGALDALSGTLAISTVVPKMTSNTLPSGRVEILDIPFTDSNTNRAYIPLSGNTNASSFICGGNNKNYLGLTYMFTSTKVIQGIGIRSGNYGGVYRLKDFKVKASNDGSNYVDIASFSQPADYDFHKFFFQNTSSYKYWRVYAENTYNNSGQFTPCIAQLELYSLI